MTLRARAASILLLIAGLVPVSSASADAPDDGYERYLVVQPGSLTQTEPWIAYPGDGDTAAAVVWSTEPATGPIGIESCMWDFGDGEVRQGVSDRRPGWCRLGKMWDAPGTYTVALELRDVEGREWSETYTVEVRERPVMRQRLRTDRWRRVPVEAPAGTAWDLRLSPRLDPTTRPPCVLRQPPAGLRVRCTERGAFHLVGRDSASGWSVQVDLLVRNRR